MSQTEAAATYGVSLRAVTKWMRLLRDGGLKALNRGKRGWHPGGGRLNATKAARIRWLIVGRMPDQFELPFYLWTREPVAHLINREYGITLSATTWGVTSKRKV